MKKSIIISTVIILLLVLTVSARYVNVGDNEYYFFDKPIPQLFGVASNSLDYCISYVGYEIAPSTSINSGRCVKISGCSSISGGYCQACITSVVSSSYCISSPPGDGTTPPPNNPIQTPTLPTKSSGSVQIIDYPRTIQLGYHDLIKIDAKVTFSQIGRDCTRLSTNLDGTKSCTYLVEALPVECPLDSCPILFLDSSLFSSFSYTIEKSRCDSNPFFASYYFAVKNGDILDGSFILKAPVNSHPSGDYKYKIQVYDGCGGNKIPIASNLITIKAERPTDVCPNIAGNQIEIPGGRVKDSYGNCVDIDYCPNIEGQQDSIPSGYNRDNLGNCVTVVLPPGTTTTNTLSNVDTSEFACCVSQKKIVNYLFTPTISTEIETLNKKNIGNFLLPSIELTKAFDLAENSASTHPEIITNYNLLKSKIKDAEWGVDDFTYIEYGKTPLFRTSSTEVCLGIPLFSYRQHPYITTEIDCISEIVRQQSKIQTILNGQPGYLDIKKGIYEYEMDIKESKGGKVKALQIEDLTSAQNFPSPNEIRDSICSIDAECKLEQARSINCYNPSKFTSQFGAKIPESKGQIVTDTVGLVGGCLVGGFAGVTTGSLFGAAPAATGVGVVVTPITIPVGAIIGGLIGCPIGSATAFFAERAVSKPENLGVCVSQPSSALISGTFDFNELWLKINPSVWGRAIFDVEYGEIVGWAITIGGIILIFSLLRKK